MPCSNGCVDANSIGLGAVTTLKLGDGAVTGAKIANSTIDATKLTDNAVNTNEIANSAVTSAKIADGTIAAADIGNGQVTRVKTAADLMLPAAFGVVNADGSCPASQRSANVSCTRLGTGRYQMTFTNVASPYIALATIVHTTDFASASIESTSGQLIVRTRGTGSNANVDRAFHFVVFKP